MLTPTLNAVPFVLVCVYPPNNNAWPSKPFVQSRLTHAQHAALEHQMEEEKRSREGKLRDRLAKKRKAKEAEMQEAALSERVSDLEDGC